MTSPVDESWTRILAWLSDHAPAAAGALENQGKLSALRDARPYVTDRGTLYWE